MSIICRSCGSELKHKQVKKCHVCQSEQTWKRHLGFSSTILALLTALASIAAVSWEKIEPHFLHEHVFVDVIDVDDSALMMVVINNTLSPVWIKKSVIWNETKDNPVKLELDREERYIDVGKHTYLRANISHLGSLMKRIYLKESSHRSFIKDVKKGLLNMYGDEGKGRSNKVDGCFVELSYALGKDQGGTQEFNIEGIPVKLDNRQANLLINKLNYILGFELERDDWLSVDDIIEKTDNLCTQMYYETYINTWYEVAEGYLSIYNASNKRSN